MENKKYKVEFMKTKKHCHKWQFAEQLPSFPLWQTFMDRKICIGYSKPALKFVCVCGKTKIVEEK